MDSIEKFVAELNISRFVSQLEIEADPMQRQLWTKLLLAEENRFAKLSERLDMSERCLEGCNGRIREQQERMGRMDESHPQFESAKAFLANLHEIEHSVSAYRKTLMALMRIGG
jgi:hypothetical protein